MTDKKTAIVKAEDWTPSAPVTIENLRKYLPCGRQLSDQEVDIAVRRCLHSKLDPFKARPDVYIIKYTKDDPMSLVVAYEVYLRRADALKSLDGWETGTTGDPGQDGFKAWVKIHRKDWKMPFYHEVRWEEYAQYKKWNDKWTLTKFWRKMPQTMLVKVAVSQAFRLCFPNSYEDLPYTDAEMPLQADIQTGAEILEAEIVNIPEAKERKKDVQNIVREVVQNIPGPDKEEVQPQEPDEEDGEREPERAPETEASEEKEKPKQKETQQPAKKATILKDTPVSKPDEAPWDPPERETEPPLESYDDPAPEQKSLPMEEPVSREPGDDEDEDPAEQDPREIVRDMIKALVDTYGDSGERLDKAIKGRCKETTGVAPKNVPDDLTDEQAAIIIKALGASIENKKMEGRK